jgi:hypothetical protein
VADALRYIQVGELVEGMSEDVLPPAEDLSGSQHTLFGEDGSVTRLEFAAGGRLLWDELEGPRAGAHGEEEARVTQPRDGVFVADFVSASLRATSVTVVLDVAHAAATTVIGTLPTPEQAARSAYDLATAGEELTSVAVTFARAAIDRAFVADAHPHVPTADMVGRRVEYVYTSTEKYEHIYLSDDLYTWQCLAGSEKGLADTDRCHHRRIGDELYLFVWREKIIPTLGVVLVDWRARVSNGKLFGYESSDFGALCSTPISSRAHLLNVTTYVRQDREAT